MSHFIKKCKKCDTVIEQCRCASPNKIIQYDVCDNCLPKTTSISQFACGLQLPDEDEEF